MINVVSGTRPAGLLKRIPVRTGNRIIFVRVEEIDWIESAGNYAVLHCGKENHVIRHTIKGLEDMLPREGFLRVSRSALVNRDRVLELQPSPEGVYAVVLSGGTRVAMTRGPREVEESLKFA